MDKRKTVVFAYIVQLTLDNDAKRGSIDGLYDTALDAVKNGQCRYSSIMETAWSSSDSSSVMYGEEGFEVYEMTPTGWKIVGIIPYDSIIGRSINTAFYKDRCQQLGHGGGQ